MNRSTESSPWPSSALCGIRIATVTAMHSNGLDPDYIGGELGKAMKEAGIAGDFGLPTGYVVRFSNGLMAYLSGDTGITADQELVVPEAFIKASKVPVHVPLSGKTMEFDAAGRCTAGC